jgi:hypothetical protein
MSSAEAKEVEWDKMERFLSGSACRRMFLDAEMDGREDRVRCEEGEKRCDVCENDDAIWRSQRHNGWNMFERGRRGVSERSKQSKRGRTDGWIAAAFPVGAIVFRSPVVVQHPH